MLRLLRFVWFVVLIPLSSLAAGAKTQPSGTYRLHPESCYGAIGLDMMSWYGAAGPNYPYHIQAKRRKFLAWDYLSGGFLKHYERTIASGLSPSGQQSDKTEVDRLYGDIIPAAYAAMGLFGSGE